MATAVRFITRIQDADDYGDALAWASAHTFNDGLTAKRDSADARGTINVVASTPGGLPGITIGSVGGADNQPVWQIMADPTPSLSFHRKDWLVPAQGYDWLIVLDQYPPLVSIGAGPAPQAQFHVKNIVNTDVPMRVDSVAGSLDSILQVAVNNVVWSHFWNEGKLALGTSGQPARWLDAVSNSEPQIRTTHTIGTRYVEWWADASGNANITPVGGNILNVLTDTGVNTNTQIRVKGKGTGRGQILVFDQDDLEYFTLECYSGLGYFSTGGVAPGVLKFNAGAHAGANFFDESASGETVELKIGGFRAGDALRLLAIGVGVDVANQASFDGLQDYWFNGNVKAQNAFYSGGNQGESGTLTVDDGANWRFTLTFTGGILTSHTVGGTAGVACTWT